MTDTSKLPPEPLLEGGRIKSPWRPFKPPAGWRGQASRMTYHARQRCLERRIPAQLLPRFLPLADLCCESRDGAVMLKFSRTALKRMARHPDTSRFLGLLAAIMIVVEMGGLVISVWRADRPRRLHLREMLEPDMAPYALNQIGREPIPPAPSPAWA